MTSTWGSRLFRAIKRKWAICSSRGNVAVNTNLLSQPVLFRAEVIVHGLLQLRVPNDGKLFTALMKSYLTGSDDN